MKKILAALLMLALCFTLAHAESDPKIILLTVYQQMGWGDRIDVGCVDEEGGIWTMTGSASSLGWPGGIEEQLSYAAGMDYMSGEQITLNFTPHLIPMDRGILATCYADLKSGADAGAVEAAYRNYYESEFFIRLLGKDRFPETRWVKGSNFVDIGFTVDERTHRVIACGALDNLVKGAAGQAVQNMNLLFGLEENTGLKLVPMFP